MINCEEKLNTTLCWTG